MNLILILLVWRLLFEIWCMVLVFSVMCWVLSWLLCGSLMCLVMICNFLGWLLMLG